MSKGNEGQEMVELICSLRAGDQIQINFSRSRPWDTISKGVLGKIIMHWFAGGIDVADKTIFSLKVAADNENWDLCPSMMITIEKGLKLSLFADQLAFLSKVVESIKKL